MNDSKPLLSVIIPVYNSREVLPLCIDSVLNQTYMNFELILIDDVSTDGSGAVCDAYSEKYRQVRVVHHTENKGLSASREEGVSLAKGDYVAFIDHDDYIEPFMLKVLAETIGNYDIAVIGGKNVSEEELQQIAEEKTTEPVFAIKAMSGEEAVRYIFKGESGFIVSATWGKLYRKTVVLKALSYLREYKNTLPWVYLEDLMFLPICVSMAESVGFASALCYYHRLCAQNLSSQSVPGRYHYDCITAGEIVLKYFKEQKMEELSRMYLPSYLLNLESTWYRVTLFEKDTEKKEKYKKIIEKLHTAYYQDVQKSVVSGAEYMSIKLFQKARGLWKFVLGNLYFKKKYKA